MKLKLLILILVLCSLLNITIATDDIKTVNRDIDVKFDFERNGQEYDLWVRIGGSERHIEWNNDTLSGETGWLDDLTWTVNIKKNITESDCEYYTEEQRDWENLTKSMIKVIDNCGEAAKFGNDTRYFASLYAGCAEGAGYCSASLRKCKNETIPLQNAANDLTNCLRDRDKYSINYESCNTDLTAAQKSKQSAYLIGAALGGAAIWFFLGTKKRRSEINDPRSPH